MNKNNLFKELYDMDIDNIAQDFPVLTDEEKERIYTMSERKYNIKNNKNADDKYEDEIVVSGVERYKRPAFLKYASAAAALVLTIGGISGSFMLINRGVRPVPSTNTETTEITTNEATTGTEPSSQSQIEEYKNIAEELTDKLAHYDQIVYDLNIPYDESDMLTFRFYNSNAPDTEAVEEHYCRVTDPEIQSGADLKNALLSLFGEDLKYELSNSEYRMSENDLMLKEGHYFYISSAFEVDLSDYENGSEIDRAALPYSRGYMMYRGNLYVKIYDTESDTHYFISGPEIIAPGENSFKASRYTVDSMFNEYNDSESGTRIIYDFIKEGNEWKINGIESGNAVDLWTAAAIQAYFNYQCQEYSPSELDINDDIRDDGVTMAIGIEKLVDSVRILHNNDDGSSLVNCIIRNKDGEDYLDFTAEITMKDHFFDVSIAGIDENNFTDYFEYNNVDIKVIN